MRPLRPLLAGTIVAAAVLTGCATRPAPTQEIATATASIEAARTAGAGETATVELNRAVDKLERARALSRDGQQVEARRLAEDANADAQVARAKAGAVSSQRGLVELRASVQSLRNDMARQDGGSAMPAPAPMTRPQ